ncbi:peptide/nickel transport system substrate-binding protein [Murinocardiopsis flavida]|uniref:Peptide/nickel transport system substrate-binding protein n=1 Tax=Murinocardiopsis flavida TaxID=645275 RepID=A0A2P8D272_9ACTN|nr:ABC transporter family substrate-binding protein [Murinocardiopsis flavida]PSK91299.1 peptide/nickel transport system substrate-binding protein [Murinocardiopsis flavida]
MRMRRSAALAAPLLALALVASACSGGGDGGGENEEKLADIPAQDINVQGRDKLKDGGDFHWGINEYPTQYNTFHPDGNLANVVRIVHSSMPIAHKYDEKGVPQPNKAFVEESDISEDGKTLTFTLNPEAEWSDGKPITWEDYKEQVETVGGHTGNKKFEIGNPDGYENIEKVEEGGENEVVFTFETPYAEWPRLFEPLYPKEFMKDPKKFNEGYKSAMPVTSGPFGDVKFDDTAETITVNKDDKWWGDEAKLDSIVYHNYESDTLPKIYNNDEIDGFYLGYDGAGYDLLKDKEGSRITKAVNNGYRLISLNGGEGRGPLEDPKIRNAITHGIDRSALASASLEAIDWSTDPTVNRLLRSPQPGFKDNSKGYGEYDPEKAGKMLDEAGWKQEKEGAVRRKDGKEFTLQWVITSGLQISQDEAEIAQSQLKEIGVKVDIESVPNTAFFEEYIIPGKYDMATYVLTGTVPYAGDSAENFAGPQGKDEDGEEIWGNNLSFTSNDKINDGFDELVTLTDPDEYAAKANEIDRELWKFGVGVPLYQRPGNFAVKADLANWGENGLASIKYEDIGWLEK